MIIIIIKIVFLASNSEHEQVLTNGDINTLKEGCNNLQELLLPENEVKFTHKIGEGIYCSYIATYSF